MRRLTVKERQERDVMARRIVAAMDHAGLTQRALAKALGVSQSLVSQIVRGVFPGHKYLSGIAQACRVPVKYLSHGTGWSGGPAELINPRPSPGGRGSRQMPEEPGAHPARGPGGLSLPTRLVDLEDALRSTAKAGSVTVALAEPVGRKLVQEVASGSGLRLPMGPATVYLVIVAARPQRK